MEEKLFKRMKLFINGEMFFYYVDNPPGRTNKVFTNHGTFSVCRH